MQEDPVWNVQLGKQHKFKGQQLLEDQWTKGLLTGEEYEAQGERIGNTAPREQEVQQSSGEEHLFEMLRELTKGYDRVGNQSLKYARLVGSVVVQIEELEKLSMKEISIKLGSWGESQLGKFKAFFLLVREFPLLMRLTVFATSIINNLKILRDYLQTSAGNPFLSLSCLFVSLSHKAHRQQVAQQELGAT